MTEPTTLLQELEQAADEIDRLCACNFISCPNKDLTARLRARMEHVQQMLDGYRVPFTDRARGVKAGLLALTGPIPSAQREGGG